MFGVGPEVPGFFGLLIPMSVFSSPLIWLTGCAGA